MIVDIIVDSCTVLPCVAENHLHGPAITITTQQFKEEVHLNEDILVILVGIVKSDDCCVSCVSNFH